MTVEQVRKVYEAQPFRPFRLHLADGRELQVLSREFLAFSPSGRTIFIYHPDESFDIVDLLLVTDLEFGVPPGMRGKRRRSRG